MYKCIEAASRSNMFTEFIVPSLTLLIAGGAVAVAIIGLNTWRRQIRGTFDFELARKLSLAAYEFKDEVDSTRNPWVQGKVEEVYDERWKSLLNASSSLKTSLLEAQVVWDKQRAIYLRQNMDEIIKTLYISIDGYLQSKKTNDKDFKKELHSDNDRKVMYSGYELPTDKFASKVNDFIENIEEFVKPKMSK